MDIGIPRFYIDAVLFAHATGQINNIDSPELWFLNLARGGEIDIDSNSYYSEFKSVEFDTEKLVSGINYVAVLGHKWNHTTSGQDHISFNLKTSRLLGGSSVSTYYITSSPASLTTLNADQIADTTSGWGDSYPSGVPQFEPDNSGYSIVRTTNEMSGNSPISFFNNSDLVDDDGSRARLISMRLHQQTSTELTTRIGGLSMGWTYTMPHPPDLSLDYGIEYDGYDTTTTPGGSTLTNIRWFKPDYDGGRSNIWDFHTSSGIGLKSSPSGRREWGLKFNYLNRTDMHGVDLAGVKESFYGSDMMFHWGDPGGGLDNQWIGLKHDFYSRVIHGTLGGALPFIFQPDSTKDDYAVCRFDQDSFVFRQILPDIWEISLKIIETW